MSNLRKISKTLYLNYKLRSSKAIYLKNISHYMKNNDMSKVIISKDDIKKYINKWKVLDKNVSPNFFIAYSNLYGKMDINYVPDYLYRYPIEKILLNRRYSASANDKNLYDKLNGGKYKKLFPVTLLRNIEGVFYDEEYNHLVHIDKVIDAFNDDVIIFKKSIDTSSGKGVFFFIRDEKTGKYYLSKNKNIELIEFLANKKNYLLQKKVQQNSMLSQINKSSVNSIRVVTYRSVVDEKVHVLQMLIKRGGINNDVDNLNSGGSFVEVNKNGKIASFGIDMFGVKIPLELNDYNLRWYNEICEIAKEIGSQDYFNRQLFFDFFIDDSGNVGIMEINHASHPPIQAVCGPAFGKYTDEVIAYCLKTKGNINITFPFKWA